MARTKTTFVNLERLFRQNNHASIIIRLMAAFNDISLADGYFRKYESRKDKISIRRHMIIGSARYFVNLQCGHLCEAINIIKEINNDETLKNYVDRCSEEARDSYVRLIDSLKGGRDYSEFQKLFEKIRSVIIFHYFENPNLVNRALSNMISSGNTCSKITVGDDISLWRFELADEIIDEIVCNQLLSSESTTSPRKELDRILDYGAKLCNDFLIFSSEFISRHINEHAAI